MMIKMENYTNGFGFNLSRVFSDNGLDSGSLSLNGRRNNFSLRRSIDKSSC